MCENTNTYLRSLEVEELTRLYVESSDSNNGSNEELVKIVKKEHEYLYGYSNIDFLDNAQLKNLNEKIGEEILFKLSEQYVNHSKEKDSQSSAEIIDKFFEENKDYELASVQKLEIVHKNLFDANILNMDIEWVIISDNLLGICLDKDYAYGSSGNTRWKSIEAFDKDEITHVYIKDGLGTEYDMNVPFSNTSKSGSYCINSKSKCYEDDNRILIVWRK